MSMTEARARLAASTPLEKATFTRYDHGGGRLYIAGENRELILDAYDEADREFYFHARADLAAAFARIAELEAALIGIFEETKMESVRFQTAYAIKVAAELLKEGT